MSICVGDDGSRSTGSGIKNDPFFNLVWKSVMEGASLDPSSLGFIFKFKLRNRGWFMIKDCSDQRLDSFLESRTEITIRDLV